MGTAAQRRAQRTYHHRRRVARVPRTDDLQRALTQALRDTCPRHITDPVAMRMLVAILKDARRRLVRRGFDDQKAWERLKAILRSLVVNRDGEVIDGAAELMALGIEVPEHRR